MASRTGLVLGKFAPLHLGHQYLIETARSQVDKLCVLIYEDDGLSRVPLARRARWIRFLYPDVTVIEGHGSPTCCGMDEGTQRIQEAYIKSVVPQPITHFFGSESYVDHVAVALHAISVLVDQERSRYHISATRLRDNPRLALDWCHPYVRRDLVRKCVFLGAESSGKSTLCAHMGHEMSNFAVPEYGREYWLENHDEDGRLASWDMDAIAACHRMAEDRACEQSVGWCFVDTNALTTALFCRRYGRVSGHLLDRFAGECYDRYALTILCDIDIPFVQDGTRDFEHTRPCQQDEIVTDLNRRAIPFHTVSGSLDERVRQVKSLLS